MRSRLTVLPLAFAVMFAACDNGSSTTAPTPVMLTTDTFMGTVDPGGSSFNTFTVAQSGEVDITLTAAGPPPTITMGLGVGTPATTTTGTPPTTTTTCMPISGASVSTQAGSTPQLAGTASAGPLCVLVFDVGNQTATISYTVTVAHP